MDGGTFVAADGAVAELNPATSLVTGDFASEGAAGDTGIIPDADGCDGTAAKNSFARRVITSRSGSDTPLPAGFPCTSSASCRTVSADGSLVLIVVIETHIIENAQRVFCKNGNRAIQRN